MSNVVSFVEESCFSGETFRSVRREVWFTANIFGKFKVDFAADNGLWYDYTDEYLMAHLFESRPEFDWKDFVYYKKIDHSAISILHPDDARDVGIIHVRRSSKQNPSCEMGNPSCETNVIDFAEAKRKRDDAARSSEAEGTLPR